MLNMATGGLFITLYDEDTLRLYLDRGIYGQHMKPYHEEPPPQSPHYRTLADYASSREGKHVFFFLKRRIYYGGQVIGPADRGAFFVNGQHSPLGIEAKAPLVWDESDRDVYGTTGTPGIFATDRDDGGRAQPFLIRFEDELGLAGRYIISDQLYFKLGEYPYPLPSNTIAGMGFCTITPGETDLLLELLRDEPNGSIEPTSDEPVRLAGDPIPYHPRYDVDSVEAAHPESHLEASITANPRLLPADLQPGSAAICRQVPISPFKPYQMDKADLCYFAEPTIREGTVPNTILELKVSKAGKSAAQQVDRYLRWLHGRFDSEAEWIQVAVFAPGFTSTFEGYISNEFLDQVDMVEFNSPDSGGKIVS